MADQNVLNIYTQTDGNYIELDIDTSEYVELNLFNENGFDDQCENGHSCTSCMYCAENRHSLILLFSVCQMTNANHGIPGYCC